jgi:hypothetical protein
MPMLCKRLSSAWSSGLRFSCSAEGRELFSEEGESEAGSPATEYGLEGTVPFVEAGGVLVVSAGGEVEFRGRGIGLTASAPNWASRKRKRRDNRVAGSGVLWGLGCLKRWASFWTAMSSSLACE